MMKDLDFPRFKVYLREKRRYPELNPVISPIEELAKYKDDPDVYISYTEIDKIGINPQSPYNTPLGIYTYPLKEMFKEMKGDITNVPFAGLRKYVYVVKKAKGKFINDLYKDYTSKDYDRDMDKLRKMFKNHPLQKKKRSDGKNIIEVIIEDSRHNAKSKGPAWMFWWTTREFGSVFGKGSTNAISWNRVLRDLGYSGFADRSGKGIIHPSEPMQAVFLVKDAFKVLTRIDTSQNLVSQEDREIKKALMKNPHIIKTLKNPTEEQKIMAVSKLGVLVLNIKNPSEKVKIAAVASDPMAIKFIDNPSEAVSITAVKKEPSSILYVDSQTFKIQLAAVETDPNAIQFIDKPGEILQIAAVKGKPSSIKHIKNPTEKVQLLAVDINPSVVDLIKDPSSKVRMAAYKRGSKIQKGLK